MNKIDAPFGLISLCVRAHMRMRDGLRGRGGGAGALAGTDQVSRLEQTNTVSGVTQPLIICIFCLGITVKTIHVMRAVDSLEKSLMLGKTEDRRRKGNQRMAGWHH